MAIIDGQDKYLIPSKQLSTSEGNVLEKRHKNHSVATSETSNPIASR
jgi:hypothetical protein